MLMLGTKRYIVVNKRNDAIVSRNGHCCQLRDMHPLQEERDEDVARG